MKKIRSILCISLILLGVFITTAHIIELKKPDVVLITFDAMRADHLGCYGYLKDTSPFLDYFSRSALVFTNSIAQSATTVPALAALFTSHFSFLDGVVGKEYALGNKYLTLATFLKSKGYDTFAILGHRYVKNKFGFSQGFDYFDDSFGEYRNSNEIFNQFKKLFRENKIKNKFFLWVHFREPHSPYNPPEEYKSKFSVGMVKGLENRKNYIIYGEKRML